METPRLEAELENYRSHLLGPRQYQLASISRAEPIIVELLADIATTLREHPWSPHELSLRYLGLAHLEPRLVAAELSLAARETQDARRYRYLKEHLKEWHIGFEVDGHVNITTPTSHLGYKTVAEADTLDAALDALMPRM